MSSTSLTAPDWQPLAAGLAEKLRAEGAINSAAVAEAVAVTPRHHFVRSFWALNEFNSPTDLVDGANEQQRDAWLAAVYSDQLLVTQWAAEGDNRLVTSSASLPALVAHMLELTAVTHGQRVLEIGTGTGYNTALLCHLAGDTHVTSVDIDPSLTAIAQARLVRLGFRPRIVAGNGGAIEGDGEYYDRILATCAAPGAPAAWIEQLKTGGTIVTPLTLPGALVVYTKTGAGEVVGRFDVEPAWFMPLRADGEVMPNGYLPTPPEGTIPSYRGTTNVSPEDHADSEFRLWLHLHIPGLALVDSYDEDFTDRTGVILHTTEHQATITFGDKISITRQDARRLADTAEVAWRTWQQAGRPDRTRLGITSRVDGTHTVWLDEPDGTHTWPLPATA